MIENARQTVTGSYSVEDVIFLLKDLSEAALEKDTKEREWAIQQGVHYSEMLPVEYQPSEEYLQLFHESLEIYKQKVAIAAGVVSELIIDEKGRDIVFVSLARAGTPIGILMKRYVKEAYGWTVPHYSVSIIRGRGIDENALLYLLEQHPGKRLVFVDGWTGKGAISKELTRSARLFKEKYGVTLDDELAVLADPGHCSSLFGTREDFLIPSACLNSTVSGLVSRTVLNDHWIKDGDFHGAKVYRELADKDLSNYYIDIIAGEFAAVLPLVKQAKADLQKANRTPTWEGLCSIEAIQKEFGIKDINLIKPGAGETTRVLLRRVPWKILVKDKEDLRLKHIFQLAKERNVPVEEYKQMSYTCCGLIKPMEENK